ncbi:hypothetical protein [Nonomuraea rubra]|uniref:hypothetical protein n=1 Tax=Nonomuraea rubra TaxID=46180 RepID=UPI0033F8D78C
MAAVADRLSAEERESISRGLEGWSLTTSDRRVDRPPGIHGRCGIVCDRLERGRIDGVQEQR